MDATAILLQYDTDCRCFYLPSAEKFHNGIPLFLCYRYFSVPSNDTVDVTRYVGVRGREEDAAGAFHGASVGES